MKARVTVSAVMLGMGMASGHLVSQSMQVRRWVHPLEGVEVDVDVDVDVVKVSIRASEGRQWSKGVTLER